MRSSGRQSDNRLRLVSNDCGEILPGLVIERHVSRSRRRVRRLAWFIAGFILGFLVGAQGRLWAAGAPQIGNLTLPLHYWEYVEQAAKIEGIDPCLVLAVMAIESRFDRFAVNKRCQSYGLMQLQKDVYRGYGVEDPFDPEMNIRVGAHILSRLLKNCGGDVRKALKRYNPEDTGAYSREVLRAWRQARGY